MVQLLQKTVWCFLKKLKMDLPYDLVIPLVEIYLKKSKALIRKYICTPMFIARLFTMTKPQKQSRCPSTEEWIRKWHYIYTMEYYLAIKKNEDLPFAPTWMDQKGILQGGSWWTGQGGGWQRGQSHICMQINQEEQLGSETDLATQGSSAGR